MIPAVKLGAVLAVVVAFASCGRSAPPTPGASAGPAPAGPMVKVLSNRADLISGGDALVEVVLPPAASAATVSVDGRDVTSAFGRLANGRYVGLVTGLRLGRNVIAARVAGVSSGTTIVNHPNGGSIFAGPQVQPWKCQDGALDAQCNQPAEYRYSYLYKSTDPTLATLQPYDPERPPSDVAATTTDQGVTVPFIVRVETGYQNRDQYKIAALYQPDQPWSALAPQAQFNHKLLITHGANCGVDYAVGTAPSVISYIPAEAFGVPGTGGVPGAPVLDSVVYALGAGFVVMSTALDNSGHNCDVVTQAESLVMAKERVIEQYGELRYTIGTGCSGGSLAQQWIANAYPGIYQGILPTCSFPDAWTAATQVLDYHLLRRYFEDPSKWATGLAWSPTQWSDVEGHGLPLNAIVSEIGYFSAVIPTHACGGISDAQRYHPQTNPGGVRCSIIDLAINVFAPRPPSVWTGIEQGLGRGFGGVAVDNVGVQYGLSVLRQGGILPAQFLDLNEKIGGVDIDIEPVPHRLAADQPALANAYRSGMINQANNLDRTAIIDCRGPDPGAAHDSFRAFALRARLDREHGGHANQLIWEGPLPLLGDANCGQASLQAMDRWLAAVAQDDSAKPLAQKLVDDKPADLGDACYDGAGTKLADDLCPDAVVPVYGTPRMVAGDAISTDVNKCQLKPLDRADDYGPLGFSDAEWARMRALYPDGVCDFSRPGVSQQATVAWQTYQDSSGNVIYGGVALPAVPPGSGGAWADPAFAVFAP